MSDLPNKAKMFIVAVMLAAAAVSVYAIGIHIADTTREFVVLLATAIIAARLKLTLPGSESNMSMNLPFILLAISQLPMPEAIAVGAASTFVQTLPQSGKQVKPAQAVFNVCNLVNAIAIASVVAGRAMHFASLNKPFLIASAALAFFLADTLPVAAIISMTSPAKMVDTWTSLSLMTFPYFVLSAGVASIVATGIQFVGWRTGAVVLVVMLAVYRCFQYYLRKPAPVGSAHLEARAAAAD